MGASRRVGAFLLPLITIALLAIYHVLRALASGCTGSGCEWFIPVSLLLPLAILVTAALTGLRAFNRASTRNDQRGWAVGLAAVTVLGVLGPLLALFALRDKPDTFVAVGSVLTALVPLTALAYAVAGSWFDA